MFFQVDSLLVAERANWRWAFFDPDLQPLAAAVWQLVRELEQSGSEVVIENIYREHGKVADRLQIVQLTRPRVPRGCRRGT